MKVPFLYNHRQTHTLRASSDFWLYEWGNSEWYWARARQSQWVGDLDPSVLCVMCEQTAPRAAVHCVITALTGWSHLRCNYTYTHTHWAATGGNYCTTGILADCLMISHPLRTVVTETLIQDSLIIASVYFYPPLTSYIMSPLVYQNINCVVAASKQVKTNCSFQEKK